MIEFIHLRKEYDDLVAVRDLSLTIPQGEITPENFQSVETLERMVVGQLQAEKAA